jgi:hypothetical protein
MPINLQEVADGPKPVVDYNTKLTPAEVRMRSDSWCEALDESLSRLGSNIEPRSVRMAQEFKNAIQSKRVTAFVERRTVLVSSCGIFIFTVDCAKLITARTTARHYFRTLTQVPLQRYESIAIAAVTRAYADDASQERG